MGEERRQSFDVVMDVLFGSGAIAWARFTAFVFTVACVGFAAGQWNVSGRVAEQGAELEVVKQGQRALEETLNDWRYDVTEKLRDIDQQLCLMIGEQTPIQCALR